VIKEYNVDTKDSSLRTIIVGNNSRTIKIPLLEPMRNVKKSQNQEYLEFNGGAGVQHIAFLTSDIIYAVTQLRVCVLLYSSLPPDLRLDSSSACYYFFELQKHR
jgi:4-hydroxyphenylpyruvate dioxygenase